MNKQIQKVAIVLVCFKLHVVICLDRTVNSISDANRLTAEMS